MEGNKCSDVVDTEILDVGGEVEADKAKFKEDLVQDAHTVQ